MIVIGSTDLFVKITMGSSQLFCYRWLGDAYKNAVSHLVSNIKAPVKGVVGPWVHKYPHFAVPNQKLDFCKKL